MVGALSAPARRLVRGTARHARRLCPARPKVVPWKPAAPAPGVGAWLSSDRAVSLASRSGGLSAVARVARVPRGLGGSAADRRTARELLQSREPAFSCMARLAAAEPD